MYVHGDDKRKAARSQWERRIVVEKNIRVPNPEVDLQMPLSLSCSRRTGETVPLA